MNKTFPIYTILNHYSLIGNKYIFYIDIYIVLPHREKKKRNHAKSNI